MNNSAPKKILFLYTGNSCRRQMAEGFTKALKGDKFEAYSAGIDISKQHSKTLEDLAEIQFDRAIMVCHHADQHCPTLPRQTKLFHKCFDDPPKLAATAKNDEERLHHYRVVRDEIRTYIESL